ncbi:MAG TPA: hypothetical protein DDY70_00220 [Clostridiales bacterium]|nr:hypothetical protein [Clostridiales bacterium]
MEKKFKFSDLPLTSKIVYGAVIAILCISAIVVGIVAVANRKPADQNPEEKPPVSDDGGKQEEPEKPSKDEPKEPLTFVAPMVGKVSTGHSLTVPVFSTTLGAWKMHTGIDIVADEGAEVFASAPGTVTKIADDAMLGTTVEITHEGGIVTVYANLDKTLADGIAEGKAIAAGEKIGTIGDTAVSELAEEPHLHFAVRVNGETVNPLDYITEASKKASLGIDDTAA